MSDGQEFVEQADGVGVTDAFIRVITAPLFAVAAGLAGLIATGFEQIGEVVSALGDLREFIAELIAGGPITILSAGASTTAGELSQFGVAAFVVAVAVIAAGWLVWTTIDPEIPLLDNLLPWR